MAPLTILATQRWSSDVAARSAWKRNKAALARPAPAGSAVPTVVTLRFCREGPARGSLEQEPLLGKTMGA
jgi:hypothetical protein